MVLTLSWRAVRKNIARFYMRIPALPTSWPNETFHNWNPVSILSSFPNLGNLDVPIFYITCLEGKGYVKGRV